MHSQFCESVPPSTVTCCNIIRGNSAESFGEGKKGMGTNKKFPEN